MYLVYQVKNVNGMNRKVRTLVRLNVMIEAITFYWKLYTVSYIKSFQNLSYRPAEAYMFMTLKKKHTKTLKQNMQGTAWNLHKILILQCIYWLEMWLGDSTV